MGKRRDGCSSNTDPGTRLQTRLWRTLSARLCNHRGAIVVWEDCTCATNRLECFSCREVGSDCVAGNVRRKALYPQPLFRHQSTSQEDQSVDLSTRPEN